MMGTLTGGSWVNARALPQMQKIKTRVLRLMYLPVQANPLNPD
jgi:hypothetical protein